MIPLHTIDVRTISNTVGGVTTVIGIVAYNGTPARNFFHGQQVPLNADNGVLANIDRQVIARAMDQFLLWVQNGKPTG